MKKNVVTLLLLFMTFLNFNCANLDCQPKNLGKNIEAVDTCPPCDVAIPQTNAEIRLWYNNQVVIIPALNTRWIEEGFSAKKRAHLAYKIRHKARIRARWFMQNKEEVNILRKLDMQEYGNPEGPTFLYLVEKNRRNGYTGNATYEEIVKSSSRTNSLYNKRFGIKQQDK